MMKIDEMNFKFSFNNLKKLENSNNDNEINVQNIIN